MSPQSDQPQDPQLPPPDLDQSPPLLTDKALIEYLWKNGHFHQRNGDNFATFETPLEEVADLPPDHPTVVDAIISWQQLRLAMVCDGIWSPACSAQAHREAAGRCGLPDIMPQLAATAAWPADCKHAITSAHQLNTLSFQATSDQTIDKCWQYAIELWNQAADLTLSQIKDINAARIHARDRRLNRGILAWSQLAYGTCNARLEQAYNSTVSWNWHLLWTTICHEVGHALGIGHGGRGIMQPAHDSSVTGLDDWDKAQIVHRYGIKTTPPPPPPPDDVAVHHAVLELFARDGLSLARFEINPMAKD